MTHRTVFTQWLPTLALVGLGASEAVVGLQSAFDPLGRILQLPTLRAVGRRSKRSILVGGQILAVLGGAPLVAYGWMHAHPGPLALGLALACFAAATTGIAITETVWFPLLRSYVEPGQIGRFFGTLRSGWHLTLILYFLVARFWLERHPGDLAPLFAVGTLAGLLRIGSVARLPERSERTGKALSLREAFAAVRRDRRLRRYLAGVGGQGAVWAATVPFVVVLMRRVLGLSEAQVLLTTVATYAGGLVSLYPWGHLTDRVGPARVFACTSLGFSAALLALLALPGPSPHAALWLTAFFFVAAVLQAGFGVADTHVLFALAPEEAPASTLVVASVVTYAIRGAAPLAVGLALDRALAAGAAPLDAYRALFVAAALASALVPLPLRGFGRS
jgi:MFS family permease